MAVTIRTFGNNSPGLELELTSSAPDPALILIKTLTSSELNASITFSGQQFDFTYKGTFDLSSLAGVIPKNFAEAGKYSIPNAVNSLTLSSGGVTLFTETFSPALTIDRVFDLLSNSTKMVTELAGNDVYYSSTDATDNNNDTVYLYAGNDTYHANHKLLTKVDLFYGGDGVDTAVFNHKIANFTVASTKSVWNYVTQKSDLPGFSITDKTKTINTLYANQVERLQFSGTIKSHGISTTATVYVIFSLIAIKRFIQCAAF